MRNTLAVSLAAATFAAACGSTTTDPEAAGGGGSDSSATTSSASAGTACVPGSTVECPCHAVQSGTATCLADGSGYGPCQEADGRDCACPLGRSDSCCPGDGICCPCVLGCDQGTAFDRDDPETDALIACACAEGVCAEACDTECSGGGISADCAPCVQQAGMAVCKAELEACAGE